MDIQGMFYKFCRFIAVLTLGILYPFRAVGRKNVPDGAAVVCANHSSWKDPIFLAFAIPGKYHMCIMAKEELFRHKLFAAFFKAIGTFPVNRSTADMYAMKTALSCLRKGKKLAIFPEGTRTHGDGDVAPKIGAIRMAEKVGAPLLPVYIPREKKNFKRTKIIIGKPFSVPKVSEKRSKKDYELLADQLMERIYDLGKMLEAGTIS